MKTLYTLACLSLSMATIHAMETSNHRVYPLLNVASDSSAQQSEESISLLGDTFLSETEAPVPTKRLYAFLESCQSSIISAEESQNELNALRAQLRLKEDELLKLKLEHAGKLKYIAYAREMGMLKSNQIAGNTAFATSLIGMLLQIWGDPRLYDHGGNNNSLWPFVYNLAGTLGSEVYSVAYCMCVKPEQP